MVSSSLLLLGAVGLVAAQSGNVCSQSTATINSPADATALANCETVSGSVLISNSSGNTIALDGPKKIDGDLIVEDNGAIITLSSKTIQEITGTFNLQRIKLLSSLSFPSLGAVGTIFFETLNALGQLGFTNHVTKANNVTISDTFLSTLDGIDLTSISGDVNINNNRFLTSFTTQLGNLSGTLTISANGLNLSVSMPNLIWINEMEISNVSSFSTPSLAAVNGSARFDSNYFTTFQAPNLTETGSDISFVSNGALTNISFPDLTQVGGGLTIANNTKLSSISGLGALQSVGGAVLFAGSFTNFSVPKLGSVKGAFTIVSTNSTDDSCKAVQGKAPTSQGGDGSFQGTFTCTSNDSNANSNTGNGTSGGDGSSGGSSGSGTKPNSASGFSVGAYTVMTLAGLAGLVALL